MNTLESSLNEPVVEITEAEYLRALGEVPPIEQCWQGFLLGEPVDHSPQGEPRYTAYFALGPLIVGEQIFCKSTYPLTVTQFRIAVSAYTMMKDYLRDQGRDAE